MKPYRTILAIDPSVRSCGWALFYHKQRVASGTIHSHKTFPASALEVADEVWKLAPSCVTLVIEYPTYERSLRGKLCMLQGHTHNLAFLCGVLVQKIRHKHLLLPTPCQWKGQVPKVVTQNRLLGMGFSFSTADEADAIALGLWAAGIAAAVPRTRDG